MKLQGEANKLVMGGVTGTSHTFTIQATAKAFKILSDGLYSDKITAVIRELSCNAYDAHVAVGKVTTPFKIHLPNNFEPYFCVTDFGPGLSEEDVFGLYTSYFSSTKTEDNAYIGALGLGSKSPYSYCDSFTVTSYFGGEKKIYSAYLTEDGMPTIVKLNEETLDEERTGMEVQFPVKSSDYWEFCSKARKVFTYFPTTPIIVGNKDCKVVTPTYGLKGEGWGIRSNDSGGNAKAIQGTVAYTIPQLSDNHSALNELLGLPLDITFEIGDIEVAASRETISMNKVTTANIVARLTAIRGSFITQAQESIDACATLWEACVKCNELRKDYGTGRLLRGAKFTYKGQTVHEVFTIDMKLYPALSYFGMQVSYGRRRTVSEFSDHDRASIQAVPSCKIIKETEKRGVKGLTRTYLKDNNLSSGVEVVQVFKKNTTVSDTFEPLYTQAQYDEQFGKLIEAIGNPSVLTSSDIKAMLPAKEKAVRGKVNKDTFRCFENHYRWAQSWVKADDEDLDADVKYYIPTGYSKPDSSFNLDQTSELVKLTQHLIKMGLMEADAPIFEGSPAFLREFKKFSDEEKEEWISLETVLTNFVALCTPQLIKSMQGTGLSWSSVGVPFCRNWESLAEMGERYSKHPLYEAYSEVAAKIKEAEGNQKIFENYWQINGIIQRVSLPQPGNDAAISKHRDRIQRIIKKYPLASISSWNFTISEFRNILKYMVACDLLDVTENAEKESQIAV